MKRLYYVRHGETEMNKAKLWSGQIETPLTDDGQAQARITGVHVRENIPVVDIIISSPISRAQHTAMIIADEIGYPVDEIVQNDLLIERSFGALEGTSMPAYYEEYTFDDLDDVEGSETVEQLHDRAVAALEYLQSVPEDNVLVVGHGTFGRALRRVIEELPHSLEYQEAHRDEYRLQNAEIIVLIDD